MLFDERAEGEDPVAAPRARVHEALRRFGLPAAGLVLPVGDSVLNENFRVETSAGVYFLRLLKERMERRVAEAEHRLIAWAGSHGIPVVRPLVAPGGETVIEAAGRLAALFPWVGARTAAQGRMTPAEAASLGDVHGRITRTLLDYHDEVLEARPNGETAWDTGASINALSRVDDVIRYYPAPGQARLEAQAWLREQLALLESSAPRPAAGFAHLPVQLVHGDFHERNVLLDRGGRVAAVVDWERARPMPRAFELLRALDYTGLLGAAGARRHYVRAYAAHVPLGRAEAGAGVEQWWQSSLHNTWAFTEVFIRGEGRPARFLGQVVPRLRLLGDAEWRKRLADEVGSARD